MYSNLAGTRNHAKNGEEVRRTSLKLHSATGAGRAEAQFSILDLGDAVRLSAWTAPTGRGPFKEQATEAFSALGEILAQSSRPTHLTNLTVFLRKAAGQRFCEEWLAGRYGSKVPPTTFVLQSPCSGAELGIEAWAVGGKAVQVEHYGPHALAVSHHGLRWVHCGGVTAGSAADSVYGQTIAGLERMREFLAYAGSGFEHVVRTWFYLGGITGRDLNRVQRYHELNRARTDFYHGIPFCHPLWDAHGSRGVYPASSGTGTSGASLVMSCLGLQARDAQAFLLPLENPQQTPAYAYHPRYSPKSPKFSRAIALVTPNDVTTWISGTASVVNSESRHPGNFARQMHQTIGNLEGLIDRENFSLHGVKGVRAGLRDVLNLRVYLKRLQDFPQCRAICEKRFGSIPTVYALADICRSELLVEIEGLAFSKRQNSPSATRNALGGNERD